jgi:hypothetical protein
MSIFTTKMSSSCTLVPEWFDRYRSRASQQRLRDHAAKRSFCRAAVRMLRSASMPTQGHHSRVEVSLTIPRARFAVGGASLARALEFDLQSADDDCIVGFPSSSMVSHPASSKGGVNIDPPTTVRHRAFPRTAVRVEACAVSTRLGAGARIAGTGPILDRPAHHGGESGDMALARP